jgi:hypothetical protein
MKNVIGILLILSSMIGFTMFRLTNSYVDTNGILHEPFYLIPLSFLALLAGLIILIVSYVKVEMQKSQQ